MNGSRKFGSSESYCWFVSSLHAVPAASGSAAAALRAVVNASALTSTPGASREAAYWSAASEISSAPSAAFVSDATCCFVCKLPPPPPVAAATAAYETSTAIESVTNRAARRPRVLGFTAPPPVMGRSGSSGT